LKARPEFKSPKTVNNVLAVLSVLKKAVEWEVIERMPCTVKLPRLRKAQRPSTISTSTDGSSRSRGRSTRARCSWCCSAATPG
jgi:hypothetical protein